jgi:eukaryotic-like serine/threonine-protein kinase
MSFVDFIKSKTFKIHLGIAVGLSIVLVVSLLYFLDWKTEHGKEVQVPDITMLTVEEALPKLEELDLSYVILDTLDFNPDFPPFAILEQEPKSGDFVKSGRKIYVKLNPSSFGLVLVPNLEFITFRQAEPNLVALGLQIGKITYKPHFAKDVVLELHFKNTTLKPGTEIPKNSVIDIVLGDGSTNYGDEDEEFEGEETNQGYVE